MALDALYGRSLALCLHLLILLLPFFCSIFPLHPSFSPPFHSPSCPTSCLLPSPFSSLSYPPSPSPSLLTHPRFGGYILAGLKRKFLKVNNFSFSYYERPPNSLKNKPTTLFLHGFTSNKESWVRVTQNLPNSWRILVLDMPGHGESSFDSKLDYSPFGMVEKIHMVCRGK